MTQEEQKMWDKIVMSLRNIENQWVMKLAQSGISREMIDIGYKNMQSAGVARQEIERSK